MGRTSEMSCVCQRGPFCGLRTACLDLLLCAIVISHYELSSIVMNISESQKLPASHEICLAEWGVILRVGRFSFLSCFIFLFCFYFAFALFYFVLFFILVCFSFFILFFI
jgi:hypothetical protein